MPTMFEYIKCSSNFYLNLIRGDNPASFTRNRNISIIDLILQMLDRKGGSQWSDIMEFYDDLGKKQNVTETAFYLARKKFNPEAMRVMSNEFIANFFDNEAESFERRKGNLILAIDGSKIILPDTKENESTFGRISSKVGTDNYQSKPVGGLLSTLHDCLNNLFLDVQFGACTSSEQEFARLHIDNFCENYNEKAIFTLDRGYPSMRLINQLIENKQGFVFRAPSNFLKSYIDLLQAGEDKVFDVTFDRESTNYYRNDIQLRQHLMNTTYHLRFTKIAIGIDDHGMDIVEILISNLPVKEYNIDDLKELYHLRWTIETSSNRLKNRMNLESFSGFKPTLIYQDIYSDIWLYNLISLKIIEMNEKAPIEQKDESEYVLKRNFNKAIGIIKKKFIKALVMMDDNIRQEAMISIEENILGNIQWIKKDRSYKRQKTTTPSSMSYKKSY